MQRLSVLLITAIIATAIIATATVARGDLPIGINPARGIYIQEYWLDDQPYYAIANTTAGDVAIRTVGGQFSTAARHVVDVNKSAPVTPVAAHTTALMDAASLIGSDVVEFTLSSSSSLGLLRGPRAREGLPPDMIRTFGNINAGPLEHDRVELDQPIVHSAESFTVTVRLMAGHGTITFPPVAADYPLPGLAPLDVTSDQFPVTKSAKGDYSVNTNVAVDRNAMQSIRIRLSAPATALRTLRVFKASCDDHTTPAQPIVRALIIEPPAK